MSAGSVASGRLPASVLTGFLGSGKTTLLKALLRRRGPSKIAVVINEFGEVGIDNLLVREVTENMVVMDGGCVCCTVRGDLVDTLRDLFVNRTRGRVPEFERVVLETTGLADPAPIIHTLMNDPILAARYRLDGVISTVDAVHGFGQLDVNPESVKQAAVADRIIITKSDAAAPGAVEALEERLARINPAAPRIVAPFGEVDPAVLFDAGLYNPATKGPDVRRWLNEEAYAEKHDHHHDHDHDHHDHDHHDHHDHDDPDHVCGPDRDHDHHHDPNRHDDHIRSFCLYEDKPVPWEPFNDFMGELITARGADVLRVKGVMNVEESPDKPIVVHGVQHMFHPPVQLPRWPDEDHRTRLVFILRDVDKTVVEEMFKRHMFQGRFQAAV